jgi:DNA polymerase I
MEVDLNIVETWEDAEEFMRWLGQSRPILGCDTETGGFDYWRCALRTVQFGDLDTGWTIPWEGWGGLAMDALKRYDGDIVYHSMKFDLHFLEVNGCKLNHSKMHDTGTMSNLLRPGMSWALKTLGAQLVDPSIAVAQGNLKTIMAKNRYTWANVPVLLPDYWAYAALDPVITAHLYQIFKPQLTGQLAELYEVEVACQFIIAEMERRGALVDVDYCQRRQEELLTFATDMRAYVMDTYGFSVGSLKPLAAQFQNDGIVLTKQTPEGAWSMDEKVLSEIDHPLASDVLNVRKTEKMANSYFGNYIDYADSNNVLHPLVNMIGARTGRMSISRPALQQVPKNKYMRDAIIPRPGNRLVSVDFEQIEMRLLAHFSQDQPLIEAFAEEGDFFRNTARRLYGDPTIDKGDERRNVTKHASYAKVYGAGIPKFASRAGITVDEATAFIETFNTSFPGIQRFVNTVSETAMEHYKESGIPYVVTEFGRLEIAESTNKLYKLVNYMIQGTAADVFKHTIIALDDVGLTDYLVLPVHDECVFDCPAEDSEDVMHEAMAQFRKMGEHYVVPLDADGDIVERWGDKYK